MLLISFYLNGCISVFPGTSQAPFPNQQIEHSCALEQRPPQLCVQPVIAHKDSCLCCVDVQQLVCRTSFKPDMKRQNWKTKKKSGSCNFKLKHKHCQKHRAGGGWLPLPSASPLSNTDANLREGQHKIWAPRWVHSLHWSFEPKPEVAFECTWWFLAQQLSLLFLTYLNSHRLTLLCSTCTDGCGAERAAPCSVLLPAVHRVCLSRQPSASLLQGFSVTISQCFQTAPSN